MKRKAIVIHKAGEVFPAQLYYFTLGNYRGGDILNYEYIAECLGIKVGENDFFEVVLVPADDSHLFDLTL